MKLNIVSTISQNLQPAVKRYWPSLLCSFLVTFCMSYSLENGSNEFLNHLNIVAAYASVIFLGISNTLAINPSLISKKFILWGAAICAVILLYVIIPTNLESSSHFNPIHFVYYFLMVHLLAAVLPFMWKHRKNTSALWRYNQNLLFNFILSGIYAAVLYGGLAASVFTINTLILKNIFHGNTYAHLGFFFLAFGHQLMFTILLTKDTKIWTHEEEDYENPALKNFIQYIQVPILLIYLIILYLYLGKILFLWTLPKGMVSIMILIFGVIGIFTVLLSRPFENQTANVFLKKLSKNYFRLLIPLLPLLFTAVYIRISEYGLTDLRVALLYLDIWLALIVIYYTVSKKPDIWILPVSLLVFTIACRFLPYYNSGSWSLRNQQHQLKSELSLMGMYNEKTNKIDTFSPKKFDLIWIQKAKELNLDVKSDSLKNRFYMQHSCEIREKLSYILVSRSNPTVFDDIPSPLQSSKNKRNSRDLLLNNYIRNLNLPLSEYNRYNDNYEISLNYEYSQMNDDGVYANLSWPIFLEVNKKFGSCIPIKNENSDYTYFLNGKPMKYAFQIGIGNKILLCINEDHVLDLTKYIKVNSDSLIALHTKSLDSNEGYLLSKSQCNPINFTHQGIQYTLYLTKISGNTVKEGAKYKINETLVNVIDGFLYMRK